MQDDLFSAQASAPQEDLYTVSELNRFIKDVIESGFPQAIWVTGEIQQYDRNKSRKHVFFELVEKDPDSKDIIARIGLVIFANRKYEIERILKKSENAFELKDDIEVKFLCKVNFYEAGGNINLIVESIDPTYTLGRLAQAKQKLIAFLREKGVLEKNKQNALPAVPLTIGLITAFDSAAYNDFISELTKSGYGFKVYVRNTTMQGKNAEKDVVRAIRELEKIKGLEAIVVTRGGGSLAELSCFDSQLIAETIAACRLPVLSGIGHEINMTITDMAAHTFAKTPTAVARMLVQMVEEYLIQIDELLDNVLEGAEETLEREANALKQYAHDLHNIAREFFKAHHEQLLHYEHTIKARPAQLLKDARKEMTDVQEGLKRAAQTRIKNERSNLEHFTKMINVLHPRNTVKRGFSITRTKDGKVLRHAKDAGSGEELITEVIDGKITSVVQ